VGFSNAPGAENPAKVYGRCFFPWSRPVELNVQDQVNLRLEARLVDDGYIYRWETTVKSGPEPQKVKAHFNQSTFFGEALTLSSLRKQSEAYIPALNLDGQIAHLVLTLMSQETPLGEIARQVSERFSSRFPEWKDALTRVGALSQKYSR
jgi:hypothetical protein